MVFLGFGLSIFLYQINISFQNGVHQLDAVIISFGGTFEQIFERELTISETHLLH
jgi:hypothetical protein